MLAKSMEGTQEANGSGALYQKRSLWLRFSFCS
jgi:hypothetical protein